MAEFKEKLDLLTKKMAELKQKKAKLDSDKEYLLKRKAELAKKLVTHNLKDSEELVSAIEDLVTKMDTRLIDINTLLLNYDKATIVGGDASIGKENVVSSNEPKTKVQPENESIENNNLQLDEL